MSRKKILTNIFSNWTNLLIAVTASFIVSPIIVHRLGNEIYGIWVLIVSITEYFTVLDLGVSTALIRFISKYEAQGNRELSRKVYSNSFVFFAAVTVVIIAFASVFAFYFDDIFNITSLSEGYLYTVFLIAGINIALGILFSVFLGTLRAVQEFHQLNVISITTMILKNVLLVILLFSGYKLIAIAAVQLATSAAAWALQYALIRSRYAHLRFKRADTDMGVFRMIFNYSIYSFIISIALKILFFTDSIVIGSLISVTFVAFYSIPMTLMLYLERFIYSAMSVLTPVVSTNEALGNEEKNREIYILGSRYSVMLSLPALFVLFTNGDSFMAMWMGKEYGLHGASVLKILIIGYVFSLSQVIANGILKGMSRHRVFAYILMGEAACNLVMSVLLAGRYGIDGVAIGTTVPLVITNLVLVPVYTCRVLGLNYWRYLFQSYKHLFILTAAAAIGYYKIPFKVLSYTQFAEYLVFVTAVYMGFSFIFVLEDSHRKWIINTVRSKIAGTAP